MSLSYDALLTLLYSVRFRLNTFKFVSIYIKFIYRSVKYTNNLRYTHIDYQLCDRPTLSQKKRGKIYPMCIFCRTRTNLHFEMDERAQLINDYRSKIKEHLEVEAA